MNEPSYPFSHIDDKLIFEFESISETKSIRKLIEYRLIDNNTLLYNLALVDVLPNGDVSDLSVSDNKDMPKVLSTVFQSMLYFFDAKPQAKIFIQGSTPSRTRLYQIAISKYMIEFEQKFDIWGFMGSEMELFLKGKNYEIFVISTKKYKDENNRD
jgi:hypothetical protein